MTSRGWGRGLLLGVCLMGTPVVAQAQVVVVPSAADSARMRIFDRIQRLGRAPGADSALFVQDSIAKEALGSRRGGAGAAGDSTLSALLAMPGFALTEYDGGRADFSAKDRILVLHSMEGSRARVNREGLEVQADTSITYSESEGKVRTVGASTFTPPEGEVVESQGLVYDLPKGVGSARRARTSYSQGSAKWIVRGDMPLAAQDSMFMAHAIFTSCDLDTPHYHFETDEIKIIAGGIMVARPVRLYFADVPVAWFPFIAQSTSTGRASGILTPTFSVNDIVRNSTGYRRRISNLGFYWAMSDYSDAIFAMDWFSDNFVSLTSSVSYKFNRQFLDGNLDFRRYWRRDGSTELALDTRHSWQVDERTNVRISGRYASSTDFIRDNSFNPAEVTQSIDSEGGVNRRFGWGALSLSANRRQYMSDDRIEWTLPTASLSLSTITLFRAPAARASFYNNMTVGGSARLSRSTVDRAQAEAFDPSKIDTENSQASVGGSLSMGRLSLRQSVDLKQTSALDIPEAYLMFGDSAAAGDLVTGAAARSITDQTVGWRVGLDFQQPLVGSTTLTPSLTMSGSMFQSDTSALASSFVSAPSRISFGANLKTDLYRFFPGFGGYERIRHKFSPSFGYEWSPEVNPTELQKEVFRSQARALRPRNGLSITLNNTIEAKKASPDSVAADTTTAAPTSGTRDEPLRQERAEIVQLLGIRTSVIQYDFVEADSLGTFLSGFQTTRLSNSISSDFLQGLSVQVDHDLFEDTKAADGSLDRAFKPHLSQVNLSFSLSNRSSIFRLFGLLGSADDQAAEDEEATAEEDQDSLFVTPSVDESSIIPGTGAAARQTGRARQRTSGDRSWSANLSYALQRPRDENAAASQMVNGSLTLHPTDQWDVSWRTSYDLERDSFNDHTIRLTRNLHRWEANFDFLQTATGNWQFRFEVSLTDNRDLKFDYQQRNLDAGRRPTAGF